MAFLRRYNHEEEAVDEERIKKIEQELEKRGKSN